MQSNTVSIQPVFPIFVFEGNDLSLFADFHSLTTALEGIDVDDDVYQAYDSLGRKLALEARGVIRGRFVVDIGTVHTGAVSQLPSGPEFLNHLRAYLQACGQNPLSGQSLDELVQACIRSTRPSNQGGSVA